VSYASDLDLARQIMLEAAKKQPRILADPAPSALIREFADSGVNLEMGFWVADSDQGVFGLRSDLYAEIWRRFKETGIEIPFPQREIRVLGTVKATSGE